MYLRATAVAVLAACTSSSRTPTSQFEVSVDAQIIDRDHTLQVAIALDEGTDPKTGYPIPYEIEPDEHVRIGFRDQTVDLLYAHEPYDSYAYRGTLSVTGDAAAGEELRVEFDRGPDDDVTLAAPVPPPFTLMGPATWMRSEELTITWAPVSTEPMAWKTYDHRDGPIPNDTGTITFPVGVVANPAVTFNSPVALTFTRTGRIRPASPLRATTFTITQQRDIRVEDATP